MRRQGMFLAVLLVFDLVVFVAIRDSIQRTLEAGIKIDRKIIAELSAQREHIRALEEYHFLREQEDKPTPVGVLGAARP